MVELIAGVGSERSSDYAGADCSQAFTPALDGDTVADAASECKGAALNTAAVGASGRTNVFCS